MKKCHPYLIVFLALLLAPTGAWSSGWPPIVIDDFQEGIFQHTQGSASFTQTGLAPQSCIGGERTVIIIGIQDSHAARSLTLVGGEVALHAIGAAGPFDSALSLILAYEFPIRDFTQNGGLDRIVLDVESVVGEMSVEVILNDEPGLQAPGGVFSELVPLHRGEVQILLSSFVGGMDISKVRQVIVRFRVDNAGALADATIKRIRVIGNTSITEQWDVQDEVSVGPPFPMPSPWMEASHVDEQGSQQVAERISISLQQALLLSTGEAFPVEIQFSDSGNAGSPGNLASLSFVEAVSFKSKDGFDRKGSSFQRSSHSEGVFDLLISAQAPAGAISGGLEVMDSPQVPHGKVIYVPFDLRIANAAGSPTGMVGNMLRVEIPDGEPYVFADVQIIPPDIDQFGLHFELRDDDGTGGIPERVSGSNDHAPADESKRGPGQPLFNIRLEGDWVPHDPSTVARIRPTTGGLVLSAWPNVMGDRTVLRLNRPLANGASVRIFDLAGREVRSLFLSGGRNAAMWDGRDTQGQRVASGLYMARAQDVAGYAVAKLVVLR